jgi:hypothetical protein
MSKWLIDNKSTDYDLTFIYMNTGCEDERTLEFIDECDTEFGLNIIWIEAVVHSKRKACTHKVVDFNSANRDGSIFKSVCEKYGIPNRSYPHCTRELKINPFNSWVKENAPKALRAIGIRVDEIDRMDHDAKDKGIIYPLVGMNPTTKSEVNAWWSCQYFNLETPEHFGNCVTCWKKSDRKLKTVALESPESFDSFRDIEQKCSTVGAENNSGRFFRGHKTCDEIIASSKDEFNIFSDPEFHDADNNANGCSESCEFI